MKITFNISDPSGNGSPFEFTPLRAYNFGYAGRSADEVRAHVEELEELGFPAPERTPTIYPIAPAKVSAESSVSVRGTESYGEVEFALVQTTAGLLVCVASDHTDMAVETVSTARAKTIYPDLLSAEAWRYEDVADHWDSLTLTGERLGENGWETVQHGSVSSLMTPSQLLQELQSRSGEENAAGTVLLSGTIGGEIRPGAQAWRNTLSDPVMDRRLVVEYTVREEPLEL